MKNLSIKDAIDLIPKYSGFNMPLGTFLGAEKRKEQVKKLALYLLPKESFLNNPFVRKVLLREIKNLDRILKRTKRSVGKILTFKTEIQEIVNKINGINHKKHSKSDGPTAKFRKIICRIRKNRKQNAILGSMGN